MRRSCIPEIPRQKSCKPIKACSSLQNSNGYQLIISNQGKEYFMRLNKLLLCSVVILGLLNCTVELQSASNKASWTVLVYMAADNSLASFASYNINDMSAGLASTNGINVIVQWDKPDDNETYRYKITPGGYVDAGSLPTEMGFNPEQELASAMQWVIATYPADKYALVLWDHGSGILDFYPATSKTISPCLNWLHLIPMGAERGILYDDSQKTCLTDTGLRNALTAISQMLGRPLDLVAMDACLMAMVEVVLQMYGLVHLFVGSQQTVPGSGFPYSKFLNPLSLNPAGTSPLQLATSMVTSYKSYYTTSQPTSDFTLATIDVTSIHQIVNNIEQFISGVMECDSIDASQTKKIITNARKSSISFEMPQYIDLYSFYANVLQQIKKTTPKSSLILSALHLTSKPAISAAYKQALTTLSSTIEDGLTKISQIVLKKVAGRAYTAAQGLSIYFPTDGTIDPSYNDTLFAQNTNWMSFIQTFHS